MVVGQCRFNSGGSPHANGEILFLLPKKKRGPKIIFFFGNLEARDQKKKDKKRETASPSGIALLGTTASNLHFGTNPIQLARNATDAVDSGLRSRA
jgi:hypothetical protein